MGDTLEYLEELCEPWVEEVEMYLSLGYTRKEAFKLAGYAPCEECYDFL